MNYLDIAVLAFAALGLLFGFIGKAPKKIAKLVIFIAAILVAYFTYGQLFDTLQITSASILGGPKDQTVPAFLLEKITALTDSMNIPSSAIAGLMDGIIKMLSFWIMAIVCLIGFGIVGAILVAIIFHKAKKWRLVKIVTAAIGALKGAVVAIIIILPIICFAPALGEASSLVADADENTQKTVTTISTQVKESKVVNFVGEKIFDKNKVGFMVYEVEGEDGTKSERYLYDDIKAIKNLAGSYSKINDLIGGFGGDSNPIKALAEMSDDDIRALFSSLGESMESETVKEIVGSVLDEALKDSPIKIDLDKIDFANEADTFIALKGVIETDSEGNIGVKQEWTPDEVENIVEVLADSSIIDAVASGSKGMLADVDEGTQAQVTGQLESLVAQGTITQDKYDSLLQLFEKQQEKQPEPQEGSSK